MIQIHPVDDGFVLSEDDTWRPGSYASREAAEAACRLSDERLRQLQDTVSPGRITLAMLQVETRLRIDPVPMEE